MTLSLVLPPYGDLLMASSVRSRPSGVTLSCRPSRSVGNDAMCYQSRVKVHREI